MFLLFTSTFTHMVIAGIDSAETGGNLANLMFSLCLIFCGVLAQPSDFPRFWIFMYRISPFTYMVSGMLSVGLANSVVQCAENELIHFDPRPNQTCGEYIADWTTAAGGRMQNPEATSDCNFCAIEDTNVFLASISSDYSNAWRNFGILWAYVIFNIGAALALYYLVRMPKPKKEKGDKKEVGGHKGAVKEEKLDQPSHVGSSRNSNADGEKGVETARYASITGTNTPPAQEISEKA
jgi:ABC-type multidrug transport system permease subunit